MTGRGAVGRLVVVAGPTGTGKSDLALTLAERLDGEVINADSMQLYRGMDIGTAKLPVSERRGIPHHLLDVLDVVDRASVAAYQRDARAAVQAIINGGRTPILVGGSGLYLQSVVDEMAFPATDADVRAALETDLAECGADALWRRLAERDRAAADAIDPRDGRRIVRALEVMAVTGRPFTASMPAVGSPRFDAAMVCLDRRTEQLDARLAARVDAMMAAGLFDEVRGLVAVGLRDGVTARRALGYRQLLEVLDGTATLESAVDATIVATRRFVRRQRSWFRRDHRLTWLDAADDDLVDQAIRVTRGRSVG